MADVDPRNTDHDRTLDRDRDVDLDAHLDRRRPGLSRRPARTAIEHDRRAAEASSRRTRESWRD
jgi:hypothetical protein